MGGIRSLRLFLSSRLHNAWCWVKNSSILRIVECNDHHETCVAGESEMNFRIGLFLGSLILGSSPGLAADMCDPLKPNSPRDTSQEIVGKIDAKVEGLAKRLF